MADEKFVSGAASDGRPKVLLGCPGPRYNFQAVQSIIMATTGTRLAQCVHIANSPDGWDAFNDCWATGLNVCESGEYTHFAMLHSDVAPEPGWTDILLEEMERTGASMVSAVVPIKDRRGVTSCGIGDPDDCWGPLRRFTILECESFPETFNAADAGYPGGILLHNTGCWVADMRNPLWHTCDESGGLKCNFDFRHRIHRDPTRGNKWLNVRESEDWFFSRMMHEVGIRNTYITRRVKLYHIGDSEFPNHGGWGIFRDGDENTMHKWNPELAEKKKAEREALAKNPQVQHVPVGDIVSGLGYSPKYIAPEASPETVEHQENTL